MIVLLIMLVSMAVGVLGCAAYQKHGAGLGVSLGRFSTPYNALVTFVVAVLLFLLGRNPPLSALVGGFLVVGAACVLGHVWRALQAFRSQFAGRVSLPVIRRQKRGDTYWDFIDGEWAEVEREEEARKVVPV